MLAIAKMLFGSSNDRKVKSMMTRAARITTLEPKYKAMSDEELRGQTQIFRDRLAKGAKLDSLLDEAFAVTRWVDSVVHRSSQVLERLARSRK